MTDKRKKREKKEKSLDWGMGLPCGLIPFIVNTYE
jgi:hypothetical protein